MKVPNVYKLILILALAFIPMSSMAEDSYFPSIASADTADVSAQSSSQTEEDGNVKYLKDVEIHGINVVSENEVLTKLNIHKGDVYSRSAIQEGLQHVYETGYFTQKMRAIPVNNSDGTITLKIILEENAPITDFTIEGNTVVKRQTPKYCPVERSIGKN